MDSNRLSRSRVLIVGDRRENARRLNELLQRAGFRDRRITTDLVAVTRSIFDYEPHLVVLDLETTDAIDFKIIAEMRRFAPQQLWMPVLVVAADTRSDLKRAAFAGGANDLVFKPFSPTELILRIKNLLETRSAQEELLEKNSVLDQQLRQHISELRSSRFEAVHRLTLAAELRDDDTGHHIQRVGRMSALLAKTLGSSDEAVRAIRFAAPLHDVGKIGIPDSILLKRTPLTTEEFRIMATHTTIGGAMLSGSDSDPIRLARQIALAHHENWDGSGYPFGSKGKKIPLLGRIVAVADVFDALTHERPYKHAWPIDKAADEIVRLSGRKFDPDVVSAFEELREKNLLTADYVPDLDSDAFRKEYAFPSAQDSSHFSADPESSDISSLRSAVPLGLFAEAAAQS